jgi:TPR repeat protein
MSHYVKLLHSTLMALLMLVAIAGISVAGPLEDANAAYESGEYATAYRLLLPLAERGNATAELKIGKMYHDGHGVQQDYYKAKFWFEAASEHGDVVAKYNLGVLWEEGKGTPGDYNVAAGWYRLAAAQGFALAQYALGHLYDVGHGVPMNGNEATKWYQFAADGGYDLGQYKMAKIYEFGWSPMPDEDWCLPKPGGRLPGGAFPKPGVEGQNFADADAMRRCRIPQDYAKAMKWLRLAADQGNADAQYSLGTKYLDDGPAQDYGEAMKWLRLAADQEHAKAQLYLGIMYANGLGVPQDYLQAHMWLSLAVPRIPSDIIDKEKHDMAMAVRDLIASMMTPAQITEARELARVWKPTPKPVPGH